MNLIETLKNAPEVRRIGRINDDVVVFTHEDPAKLSLGVTALPMSTVRSPHELLWDRVGDVFVKTFGEVPGVVGIWHAWDDSKSEVVTGYRETEERIGGHEYGEVYDHPEGVYYIVINDMNENLVRIINEALEGLPPSTPWGIEIRLPHEVEETAARL